MLTTTVFLAVFFGTLSIGLALFIPLFLIPLKNDVADIKESVKPLKQMDEEAHRLGLREYLKPSAGTQEHHSLSPEKAARRDDLKDKARTIGLTGGEAAELQSLLEEDARDDFAKGVIGFAAFALILAGIAAIIKGLSEK